MANGDEEEEIIIARIIYSDTEIVSVIKNEVNSGITYTPYSAIVCDQEDADRFFADYPDEEKQKLTDFFENEIPTPDPYGTVEI